MSSLVLALGAAVAAPAEATEVDPRQPPDPCVDAFTSTAARQRSAVLQVVLDENRDRLEACRHLAPVGSSRPRFVPVRVRVHAEARHVCLPDAWRRSRVGQCLSRVLGALEYPSPSQVEVLDLVFEHRPPPPVVVPPSEPEAVAPGDDTSYAFVIGALDVLSKVGLAGLAISPIVAVTVTGALSIAVGPIVHATHGNAGAAALSALLRGVRLVAVGVTLLKTIGCTADGGNSDGVLCSTGGLVGVFAAVGALASIPIVIFDYFVFPYTTPDGHGQEASSGVRWAPTITSDGERTFVGVGGVF